MNETMGNRIYKYRREKGFTQEELAEKLGVSSQAVSKWENDASCPDISLLPQLCGILGITTDELLTGKSSEVRVLPEGERKSMDELILRVHINSAEGDRVRVNLPVSLVKACVEMGLSFSNISSAGGDAVKDLDISKIMELADRGVIGKLVEIDSAEGDRVEVVIE